MVSARWFDWLACRAHSPFHWVGEHLLPKELSPRERSTSLTLDETDQVLFVRTCNPCGEWLSRDHDAVALPERAWWASIVHRLAADPRASAPNGHWRAVAVADIPLREVDWLPQQRWDHNIAYHGALLNAVPEGAQFALDIGCGDGVFARRLAERCGLVDAIDLSPAMITAARELDQGIGHVNYAVADFITAELPSGAYDYISAIAVLHHLPFEDALTKARTLLRPGGTIAVLGLYRSASLTDLALSAIAFPLNRALLGWHRHERYHASTIAPALSFREITQTVERVLPGARISRRLLWRYFAVWDKPVDA